MNENMNSMKQKSVKSQGSPDKQTRKFIIETDSHGYGG